MAVSGGIAVVSFGSAGAQWTIGSIGWGEVAEPVPVLLGELGGGEGDGTWLESDAVHVQYLGADLAPLTYHVVYDGADVTADTTVWTGHPDGIPRLLYALPSPTPGGDRIFTVTVTDHAGHTQSADYTLHVLWTAPPYVVANVAYQNLGTATVAAGPPPAGIGRYASWVTISAIFGQDGTTGSTVPTQLTVNVHIEDVPSGVISSYYWGITLYPDAGARTAQGSFLANYASSEERIVGIELGEGNIGLGYNYCYFTVGAFLPARVDAVFETPFGDTVTNNDPPEYPPFPTGPFV